MWTIGNCKSLLRETVMLMLYQKYQIACDRFKEWSQVIGLKLNSSKSGFLHVSSRYRLSNPILTLNLDCTFVHSTKTCTNLQVIFMISSCFKKISLTKMLFGIILGCTKEGKFESFWTGLPPNA